jgi:hypothetical protein
MKRSISFFIDIASRAWKLIFFCSWKVYSFFLLVRLLVRVSYTMKTHYIDFPRRTNFFHSLSLENFPIHFTPINFNFFFPHSIDPQCDCCGITPTFCSFFTDLVACSHSLTIYIYSYLYILLKKLCEWMRVFVRISEIARKIFTSCYQCIFSWTSTHIHRRHRHRRRRRLPLFSPLLLPEKGEKSFFYYFRFQGLRKFQFWSISVGKITIITRAPSRVEKDVEKLKSV